MIKLRFISLGLFLLLISTWGYSQCTINAGPDTTICKGGTAHLHVTGQLMFSYTWSPAATLNSAFYDSPYAHPLVTTTYHVNVTTLIDSNLIVNGDFSAGNSGFISNYTYNPTTLWNEGTYAVVSNPNSVHPNFAACPDHTTGTGNMLVVNGAALASVNIWCETVSVLPNTNYAFSTWLTSVTPNSPAILQFSINGVVLGNPFNAVGTNCLWQQFYEIWNSGTATSAQICIVNQNTALSGNDFALDDISFKPFCVATDSVTVFIDHVNANAGNDTSICTGDPVTLMATGGVSYQWDAGPATQYLTVYPSRDTIYFVTVTDNLGCKGNDSVRVHLLPLPHAEAGPEQHICPQKIATLTASGGLSYAWSTGDNTQSTNVSPPISSNYYVTVFDGNGCHSYDSTWVWVFPKPIIKAFHDTAICPGANANLFANGAVSYRWSPATAVSDTIGQNIVANPQENIRYYVRGTDANGCIDTASVKIEILECGVTIPNVFTPNGDGWNDEFRIDYKGIKKYDLKVYDRWGRRVFESHDKNIFWDGTRHGEPATEGVYYYILMLNQDVHSGSVTLLR